MEAAPLEAKKVVARLASGSVGEVMEEAETVAAKAAEKVEVGTAAGSEASTAQRTEDHSRHNLCLACKCCQKSGFRRGTSSCHRCNTHPLHQHTCSCTSLV